MNGYPPPHQLPDMSQLFISPRTVETHRQNIKQKLNLQNSAQLIRSAIQWVLEDH